jgi:hypothetical protein
MMARPLAVILLIFFISGCRTGGILLQETPLGASETRRTIVSVIGEPLSMSKSGNELISHYYDRKGSRIEKMDMAKERFYTVVTILNDRRPYDLRVEVFHEIRDLEGGFESRGQDDDRASLTAEKIKQALNQSRDKRNVIDDFRSF